MPDGRFQITDADHIIICPLPLRSNPLAVVLVYFGALAGLSLAFAAVARIVELYLCPVVLVASLLALGIVGAIQLARDGSLNRSFVELMSIFYKGLPAILGKKIPEGRVVKERGPSGARYSSVGRSV